jgi:hypothetical protein
MQRSNVFQKLAIGSRVFQATRSSRCAIRPVPRTSASA